MRHDPTIVDAPPSHIPLLTTLTIWSQVPAPRHPKQTYRSPRVRPSPVSISLYCNCDPSANVHYCPGDALFSNLDTACAILKDVSEAINGVPYLKAISGVTMTILQVKDVSIHVSLLADGDKDAGIAGNTAIPIGVGSCLRRREKYISDDRGLVSEIHRWYIRGGRAASCPQGLHS